MQSTPSRGATPHCRGVWRDESQRRVHSLNTQPSNCLPHCPLPIPHFSFPQFLTPFDPGWESAKLSFRGVMFARHGSFRFRITAP